MFASGHSRHFGRPPSRRSLPEGYAIRLASEKLLRRVASVLTLGGLLGVVLCFGGCVNPKELPGFKALVREQEADQTRATEEALKQSPSLQELDRLCRDEVSLPDGFVPVYRSHDQKQKRSLANYYYSKAEYGQVWSFYKDRLTRRGWRLSGEREGGWGSDKLEFERDGYRVTIYRGGMGDGINYSINCTKSAEADGNASGG